MIHEPFTLFTLRWNGRFLHLHQNICNNHCNTATKAYHTMNQRTMVADHLQRAMVIRHTTVTDVADGFQRIRHRNALIFKCTDFRCIVYVILYEKSLSCHPEELCDEGSRVHTLYYSLLYVHELLRFALDDKTKTPYLQVLTNRQMRQGRFFNAPRRIHEFVKEFSSKHQGLFQKVLHLFEKVLSSV